MQCTTRVKEREREYDLISANNDKLVNNEGTSFINNDANNDVRAQRTCTWLNECLVKHSDHLSVHFKLYRAVDISMFYPDWRKKKAKSGSVLTWFIKLYYLPGLLFPHLNHIRKKRHIICARNWSKWAKNW